MLGTTLGTMLGIMLGTTLDTMLGIMLGTTLDTILGTMLGTMLCTMLGTYGYCNDSPESIVHCLYYLYLHSKYSSSYL